MFSGPVSIAKIDVTFLGVGSAVQQNLGHAAAVVEMDAVSSASDAESNMEKKRLLIDCGPGVIDRYQSRYGELPTDIFITHCHFDHISDLESLFCKAWFDETQNQKPKIYVPVQIVQLLHQRIASYPGALAEGGAYFWEAFQLILVNDSLIFNQHNFQVIPVRHHAPNSAFGLALPGCFFYTGDSRPIPEIIQHSLTGTELIFHDCAIESNPSHTGLEDLLREYPEEILARTRVYHYHKESDVTLFQARNITPVLPGESFELGIQSNIRYFNQARAQQR